MEQQIKEAFKLNKSSCKMLKTIILNRGIEMKTLEKIYDKERTTMQRTLNKLVEKGLIRKQQINGSDFDKRGYKFRYSIEESKRLELINYITDKKFKLDNCIKQLWGL